jgi:hypothetical protein
VHLTWQEQVGDAAARRSGGRCEELGTWLQTAAGPGGGRRQQQRQATTSPSYVTRVSISCGRGRREPPSSRPGCPRRRATTMGARMADGRRACLSVEWSSRRMVVRLEGGGAAGQSGDEAAVSLSPHVGSRSRGRRRSNWG